MLSYEIFNLYTTVAVISKIKMLKSYSFANTNLIRRPYILPKL